MNDSTKTRGDGNVRMRLDGDELFFVIGDDGGRVPAGSLAPARARSSPDPSSGSETPRRALHRSCDR